MPIGELFILGFFGKTIPAWLREFAGRYGLGGVILFDYSCQTKQYDNNIESPAQVRRLCAEIAGLPSRPMVFIDQEGGLVRRLKDARGFQPLPSAKEFNHLGAREKRETLLASFTEMRQLGIAYDFAPVIDVDYNKDNPNIGKIKRSYSADIGEVEANALLMSEVAREAGIGLCLKHFPGIGGAQPAKAGRRQGQGIVAVPLPDDGVTDEDGIAEHLWRQRVEQLLLFGAQTVRNVSEFQMRIH